MLVSTKGRYALRVMVDLAEHQAAGRIPLKEIAARQGISEKYLENILATLVRANMLSGMRGKGGGYVLTRPPEQYTVGEILRLTEGSLAPVACLDGDCKGCSRSDECHARRVEEPGQAHQRLPRRCDARSACRSQPWLRLRHLTHTCIWGRGRNGRFSRPLRLGK